MPVRPGTHPRRKSRATCTWIVQVILVAPEFELSGRANNGRLMATV
jgi:hypothetical protein